MRALPITLLILALAAGAGAQLSPAERDKNIASFEQTWKTVRDKHWDPKLNGLDWQAVHDELRPKVDKADSPDQVRDVIRDMLKRLKQSHFGLIPAETHAQMQDSPADSLAKTEDESGSDAVTGLDVRLVDGRMLVTSIEPGSPAARLKIHPGWEVAAIEGKPVAPAVAAITKAVEPNMLALAMRSAVLHKLDGAPGSSAKIEFKNGANETVEMPVSRERPRGMKTKLGFLPTTYVWSETRKLEGGIQYLAFNLFLDPVNVMKTTSDAIVACGDCKGFIIDVRGNPGGLGVMAMGIAGWFVGEKGKLLGTMFMREATLKFVVNPRPITYPGPLAILVDGCSASTSEIFAGGMQDLKRARVFGTRTAGAALPAIIEKLPNGDALMFAIADYLSESGKRLEGNGVTPDAQVELTRESLLGDRDPVIEAALQWIKQQKQQGN